MFLPIDLRLKKGVGLLYCKRLQTIGPTGLCKRFHKTFVKNIDPNNIDEHALI
jgi:hypothetical protein